MRYSTITLSAMVLCAFFIQASAALPTAASSGLSASSDAILGLRAAARPSFVDSNQRIVIRQSQEVLLADGLHGLSWSSAAAWLHKPASRTSFLSPATSKTVSEFQETSMSRITKWLDEADAKNSAKEAAQAQGQSAPAGGRYTLEEKGKQEINEGSGIPGSSGSDAFFDHTAKGSESDSWSNSNAWLHKPSYRTWFTGIRHK
ncbi:unnamed protein product [Tilletia controversa]|uniref:Uncharacterized protein n=3 Tax=Tilletia TaxID=13289 RepID=A0A8X7MVK0_9BASI|nr:hypothetical protein CF335_g5384 [Tilletia laevis]KAE8202323.1 hypothetical protein CF328_g2278 [Tilletia controversa]KAE8264060.1 hypothetical protein A4X03_0g1223 [Tilletia caries]KAE8198439.1 hypothetical protein CF336_g1681 [Tilletia laevis]KAE8250111.1 hypothetical protein A4X06_0g2917 [Tilletia controversa]